jgi:type I restriction enzyme S subunit
VSAWPVVKLSDVATLSSGGTPNKAEIAFWNGPIPWVSPKDMKTNLIEDAEDKITRDAVSESAARIVGPNSVLAVVRSGILAHTFPVAMLARDVSFNQDIKAITPKNGSLLPSYLFWMLKGQEAQILRIGVKRGATVHSLSNGYLEALRFPLPPLDQQRRIVRLLNRAAEIRRRADAARTKAHAIIPALFLDTFGDPAVNPKGWPVVTLSDVITQFTSGKNISAGNGTSKYRILKVSAVTSGIFKPEEAKPAPDDHVPSSSHHVLAGDFLFSRANTSELVGAVALAHKPPNGLLLPDKIWRIEWDQKRIDARYAYSLLRTSEIRRVFARIGSGTSSSMKNISQAKLIRVLVPLPPIALQTCFLNRSSASKRSATSSKLPLSRPTLCRPRWWQRCLTNRKKENGQAPAQAKAIDALAGGVCSVDSV